jgi:hypothetical protein
VVGEATTLKGRPIDHLTILVAPNALSNETRLELKASDLSLILDGIDLTSARRRLRYERSAAVRSLTST